MRVRYIEFIAALALAIMPCLGQGTISTVAGTSTCCADADGVAATSAHLQGADGIAVDNAGNIYIWETQLGRVRKVNAAGVIDTVAGMNGSPGGTGDGGPAASARLFGSTIHSGLAIDSAGNLYISDSNNHRVRKVDASGIITTVAGNGAPGFSGDGGPATSAMLNYPTGIALDSSGNLYIADSSNLRIRKVNTSGIISTVAGNGNVVPAGDGGPATSASFEQPRNVTVDSSGNLYLCDGRYIRRVNAAGIISTIAGTGKLGFSGDGGPGTSAQVSAPTGMAVDRAGNLYFADLNNQRIRRVDAAGIITTVVGSTAGFSGDGGPAANAQLRFPHDIAFDSAGNLYISDTSNFRIRKVAIATAAALSANPSSLSFSFTTGGAGASQSVNVTSSGSAASFTATASTTSGGNWLSVSPASGTTPATLSIAVNPAGVPAGVYQGAITLSASGSGVASLTFAVTLTVTGSAAPVFSSSGVFNALGYQSKLAPGTVFVIFGTGLGPASLATGSGPDYPTNVGGTSVTFTPASGGAAINAKMVYSVAGQIAGLLPSSIAPGTYAVRLTYNGLTSAPQNVTVVARSFGIATANGAGTGTAQATIGNINGGISLTRFTSGSVAFNGLNWILSPAHPGDTLVLWGTGGGADQANDTGGTSGDQTAAGNFSVIVGGRQITPLYTGASSGYAGLWQINFTLPADIAPDCFTPLQVSAGGELSNVVSIPIAANGQSACSDPQLSADALSRLDAGGTIAGGGFAIAKVTSTTTTTATSETAVGAVGLYTAAEYAALFSGIKIGPCLVKDRTASVTARNPAAPESYLDAGTTLPLTGPGLPPGAALGVIVTGPLYGFSPATGSIVGGGKYMLTGNGGKDVGPFNASVNFPSSFTIANWDSLNSIDRTKPLTLNWTAVGADQIYIIGSTSAVAGKDAANANIIHTVSFTCQVPAAPGTYTIPSSVLSYLLPTSANSTASLIVEAQNEQPFTASLSVGGQVAWAGFGAVLGYARNPAVQ